jgi:branched-chain amino acid transport system substrate-binding protein
MKSGMTKVAALSASAALLSMGIVSTVGAKTAHASTPTYTIAYQGPLSGGNAQLGLNMKYGVQLAINKWNATKGAAFKLALATGDDQR